MIPSNASYIWCDSAGTGRSQFVLFRRAFDLADAPDASDTSSATFSVFADTRYRLLVNGVVIGHGPARFYPLFPEFDTYDIAPYLRKGRNVIAVVVHSFGRATFSSERSLGALVGAAKIVGGDGREMSFLTDHTWKAMDCTAFGRDSVRMSFAIGPCEVLDARSLPADWACADFDDRSWPAAVAIANPGNWGKLSPRSIPLQDEREVYPLTCIGAFVGQLPADEQITWITYCWHDHQGSVLRAPVVGVMTCIHSPRAQRITLGTSWGRYWLNGQRLTGKARPGVEMRNDHDVDLREGWNSLLIVDTLIGDAQDFGIALPRSAGCALSGIRTIGSTTVAMIGGPWDGDIEAIGAEIGGITSHEAMPAQHGPWRPWHAGAVRQSPFLERNWTTLSPLPAKVAIPFATGDLAGAVGDDALVLVFEFATEVLGRPVLEFTAAEGTQVDLFYTERLVDGRPKLGIQTTRMSERCIARAGRQRWHLLHPRGFRYMEVSIRGDVRSFLLHKVAISRANYAVEEVGSFQCSDPILNRIWQIGRDTELACMEDATNDCPWRERGLYTGDMLVQYYSILAAFGDHKLMRRCIELFMRSQGDNGFLRPCSHGLSAGRHPDYSAIAIQAIWHYYARTGELALAVDHEPVIHRILEALGRLEARGLPLIDGTNTAPYVDLSHLDRDGINCGLNCFHQRAFADAARLMAAIGNERSAGEYKAHADRIAAAICDNFWSEKHNAFVDRLSGDVPETGPSVPANALAILYDIALPHQIPGALDYVVRSMVNNERVPRPTRNNEFNCSPYFSFYALEVLYRHGKVVEAEDYMRVNWKRMLDSGTPTFWEFFIDALSLCHAWATAPVHYLSSQVLGVTFPVVGDASKVRIEPKPGRLQWASGTYPHPAGPIKVSWQVIGGQLRLDARLPPGVTGV